MPHVELAVDVEALLVAHLLADVGLTYDDVLVGSELPPDLPASYVQIFKLGGTFETPETAWLERARLNVASWAATKVLASDLARLVMVSVLSTPDVTHDAGVVTAATIELTPYWSPDPETDTPRYLSTVALTVHPLAG